MLPLSANNLQRCALTLDQKHRLAEAAGERQGGEQVCNNEQDISTTYLHLCHLHERQIAQCASSTSFVPFCDQGRYIQMRAAVIENALDAEEDTIAVVCSVRGDGVF